MSIRIIRKVVLNKEKREQISRRGFNRRVAELTAALAISPGLAGMILGGVANADDGCPYPGCREAWRYEKLAAQTVRCLVCPRSCTLAPREISFCKAKQNIKGRLYSLSYSQIAALHIDPLEKGPLYHVKPGQKALAIAPAGCNLRCAYCQNWQISQSGPLSTINKNISPKSASGRAKNQELSAITFTYTEPVTYPRYLMDVCKAAKTEGLLTNMVTAGYVLPDAFKEMWSDVDVLTITLKGWKPGFYEGLAKADIAPVKKAIELAGKSGKWIEVVTLLVPGKNDDEETVREIAKFLKNELGPDVPLHFLRFLPAFKMQNLPPTPLSVMIRARKIAMAEGLRYVYLGNVPGHEGQNTLCPKCGAVLIRRVGYLTLESKMNDDKCSLCGTKIPGLWTHK